MTREEVREFLWPGGAPFDAQQAINKAVSQLRTSLRDDPASPRYIETIPRRGYRFFAEITISNQAELAQPIPSFTQTPDVILATAAKVTTLERTAVESAPNFRKWRRTIWFGTAFLVTLATVVWLKRSSQQPHPIQSVPTLAIPPLEPRGPDATRLAESFRLDLVDSLAQFPRIKVLSAHAFTSAPRDPADVARMARSQTADLLLLGKFEVKDDLCLIDLELVHSVDFAHLAAFHYQGTPAEFRHILSQAQQDIFTRLNLNATTPAVAKATSNSKAYEAYLEGRQSLIERTDESLNKAIASFKRAVALDPKFARAYSGMASAYMVLAGRDSFPDGYQMARDLALHALELDPSLAESHAILGSMAMAKDWDAIVAERELGRSLELEPDEATYHLWAATVYNFEGRFDDSLKQVDLAKQEDPYWPPVYVTEVGVAANAGDKKRLAEAAKLLLKLAPAWTLARRQIGIAYWLVGAHENALEEWRTLALLENDSAAVDEQDAGIKTLRNNGSAAYARLHVRGLDSSGDRNNRYELAEWCSYAGDTKRALTLLQALIARHDSHAVSISIDPAFTSLRTDPRFNAMLSTAGLNFKQTLGTRGPQHGAR